MAIDESDMEAAEGEHELAASLFQMVDTTLAAHEHAGNGGISREELRKAFGGLPRLNSHEIDQFLYLFELNHIGEIEKHSFVEEAQHLGVLKHVPGDGT